MGCAALVATLLVSMQESNTASHPQSMDGTAREGGYFTRFQEQRSPILLVFVACVAQSIGNGLYMDYSPEA
jgi:hypothetical protein